MASSSNSNNNKNKFSLFSSITNCSNHSVSSSCGSIRGNIVSITVRKDNTDESTIKKKAGIKLEQDSNGQVTVKNIATNGLFGDTELEIGDTILSVNRRRLNTSEGEGPDLIMKWVHKYNTITISVRKKPVPFLSSTSSDESTSSNKKDNKSITKKKKKNKKKTTTKSSKEDVTNNKKIVTITAEVNTTPTSTGYSSTNSTAKTKNKSKINKSTTPTTIGLVLEIRNDDQLFVKDIHTDSIFFSSSSTSGSDTDTDILEVGDRILCINDMSFREYADVDYAYRTMNKAKICITVYVEKQVQSTKKKRKKSKTSIKIPTSSMSSLTSSLASSSFHDDCADGDDDDDTSIKSFTDDDSDEELGSSRKSTHSKKKKEKKKSASASGSSTTRSPTTNSSKYKFEIQKSQFKIEKYCPVTITVPTVQTGYSKSSDSIGLEFRLVKTSKGDALNTIVEDQQNNRNKHDNTKWVYVHKIEEDSIFQNTLLKEGDKVISINDTDLRCSGAPTAGKTTHNGSGSSSSEGEGEGTTNIDTRKAYKACVQAKEFITIIVVKDDESIYLEKSFNFDASTTDLDWKF